MECYLICMMRLYNAVTLLMVLIAFIICTVQGIKDDSSHFLLAVNLLLSGMVSIVCNWWYRKSELSADKYWYIFLVSSVIIFQAITTDIYALHKAAPPITTRAPFTLPSTTPYTGTTMTWRTIVPGSGSVTPPTFAFLQHVTTKLYDTLYRW
ncbi:uncharacterized protein LOC127868466 isoform X2 [Dreissena polymorpha]|uniref:uncharacterized protein LOC127868466 isoform X2 n=1 Tax=Dreissena polymorpha TaxID=45954 RepID=UPI0022648DE9|nr:uncharacterized protein LOC127868466 isoform X2 [Dreissena polymorpha]